MPHQCTNCDRTFPDGSKEMLTGCPDCGGNKFQFAPAREPDQSPTTSATRANADDSTSGRSVSASTTGGTDSSRSANETGADRRPSNRPHEGSTSFAEWPETARPPGDAGSDADDVSSESRSDRQEPKRQPASRSPDRPSRSSPIAEEENAAQADARSEVVSPEELPSSTDQSDQSDQSDRTDRADSGVVDVDVNDASESGRVVSEPTGDRPSLEQLREELNQQFESIKIVRPGQYELNLMELYDREEYIVSLQEDGRYVIDVPDSWRGGDDD